MTNAAALSDRYRLLVCVGSGGVGKTTISAALAIGAALRGRRAAVITIDPARALSRAFGSAALDWNLQQIDAKLLSEHGAQGAGSLDALMLDPKRAWDELIRRYATSPGLAQKILDNRFYRELSTRFAGSSEYAAVEKLRSLFDSEKYDLIVLDTPPAAHAFDFVKAPERAERFFAPETGGWVRAGRLAVPWALSRLERAAGKRTLKDVASLLGLAETMRTAIRERSRTSRELLRSELAAFVLITTPERQAIDQTFEMLATARALSIPLRAVIVNRRRVLGAGLADDAAESGIESLLGDLRARDGFESEAEFIAKIWHDARNRDAIERERIRAFLEVAPPDLLEIDIPELDHDVNSFEVLVELSRAIYDRSGQRESGTRVDALPVNAERAGG